MSPEKIKVRFFDTDQCLWTEQLLFCPLILYIVDRIDFYEFSTHNKNPQCSPDHLPRLLYGHKLDIKCMSGY